MVFGLPVVVHGAIVMNARLLLFVIIMFVFANPLAMSVGLYFRKCWLLLLKAEKRRTLNFSEFFFFA